MARQIFSMSRAGAVIAQDVRRRTGVGLEPRHGRAPVVQEDQGEGGPLVDGVGQGRHGGMEEGGVAADGQDGLVHAELPELAETAGDAAPRAHGSGGSCRC